MPSYHVVFDASTAGPRYWWFPALGLLLVGAGAGWIALQRARTKRSQSWVRAVQPYLFTALALLWTVLASVYFYRYGRLRSALETGRFELVEGVVTNFVPMPASGHASEHFEVSGHRYAYSDYEIVPGFNNTSSHGGPIREGLQVRIADVNGEIARLEISQ